jgi:prepilin-type N-terminal cleavage/methylation domain-containing protein
MSRVRADNDYEGGFTLFELLIVIVILAILAVIVVFSVGTTRTNALSSACQSDAKAFGTALEQYKAEIGSYPALGNGNTPAPGALYGLTGNVTPTNPTGDWTYNGQTIGPFLRELPSTSHYQIVTDGYGGVFVYPPAPAHIPAGAGTMDSLAQTAGLVVFDSPTADPLLLNFETTPSICSDSNVVS